MKRYFIIVIFTYLKFPMNLSDLNDKQKEIVLYNAGPILVVAGAGSGKTKALTYKIAYLLQDMGFKGNEIFAVTFTNKAANEMKDRIGKIVGERIYFPYIGTFHSVFLSILKKEGDRIGPALYNTISFCLSFKSDRFIGNLR